MIITLAPLTAAACHVHVVLVVAYEPTYINYSGRRVWVGRRTYDKSVGEVYMPQELTSIL